MLAVPFEEHVRAAVRSAAFSTTPFPHLFVTDLLPRPFYEQVEAAWPIFDQMPRPNPTIGRLDFTDPHFNGWPLLRHWDGMEAMPLDPTQRETWATFRKLVDEVFFKQAFEYFKPHMLALGQELLEPASVEPAAKRWVSNLRRLFKRPDDLFWRSATAADFIARDQFLTARRDLSVLSPHIDPSYFHFTLIVYFAPDAEHRHLGTKLFRQAGPGRARLPSEVAGYTQYAVQYDIRCEEDRLIPFLPNAALLFVNGLHSWHGQHLDEPMERRTYNSFFTVQPDRFLAALRPQDVECLKLRKAI